MANPFEALTWLRAVIDEQCTLDASESLVLLAVIRHASKEHGVAWPGAGLLHRETRVGTTKLAQAVAEIEARGLLTRCRPMQPGDAGSEGVAPEYFRIPAERRPNVYRVALEPPVEGLVGVRRLRRLVDPEKVQETTGPPGGPHPVGNDTPTPGGPHPGHQVGGRGPPGVDKLPMELPNGTQRSKRPVHSAEAIKVLARDAMRELRTGRSR